MKVNKKVSVGGAFARKSAYEYDGQKYEADIKDGDRVEILNEGSIVVGNYGEQHVFQIRTRNGEKNATFNQKSLNNLIDGFGDETTGWIGKAVTVFIIKAMVSGKLQNIAYYAPEGWVMDENGDFSPSIDGTGDDVVDITEDDVPFA